MTIRNDDQDWMDALAGKPTPDADPKTVTNASVLREAIRKHDSNLIGEDYDPNGALNQLNARLNREGLLHKPAFKSSLARWSSLVAAIMSAFAIGAITMRFVMMPGMVGVRSEGSFTFLDGQKKFVQNVPLAVPEPAKTMRAAVAEAAQIGLNFSVRTVENGYDLLLEGLIPNSAEQVSVKEKLDIKGAAGGDLLFQIRQKPAN